MNCRDLEVLLSAYADGELLRTQREFIEEHLAGCADCRATLADFVAAGRRLSSLREVPAGPDLKEATMLKIKATSAPIGKSFRWWLRPALVVGAAAIVLALAIIQPWSGSLEPKAVLAKTHEALENIQSYRLSLFAYVTIDGNIMPQHVEITFVAPDRYHFIMTDDNKMQELIVIGDAQYTNGARSSLLVLASTARFTSFLKKETTLDLLDRLTDIQSLSDEKIDGVSCLHYLGKWDMERQIEETKRGLRKINPDITEEVMEEMAESIRSIDLEYELWIGKEDYLIRQMKTEQQMSAPAGEPTSISLTSKYFAFNEPFGIEPPLDAEGNLLPGWRLAVPFEPDENVFSKNITYSIGIEEDHNDSAHQLITFSITITNNSAQTVKNARIVVASMATNEAERPATVATAPETPELAPGESGTYNVSWKFDGSNYSKEEISRLVDLTTILVKFTTRDGEELTELLFPDAPYPSAVPPANPPKE